MKNRFLFIVTLAAICILPASGVADLPYKAQLTIEGYTISSPNILTGRFIKSESHGTHYVGHFNVKQVLAGSHKPGTILKLNSRTTTWMRFTDSDDILVFYPNTTEKRALPAVGKKAETLQGIRSFQKAQKERPFGSLDAIGIHLEMLESTNDELVFSYTVKNFSKQTWRVNLDRRVRPKNHCAVAVLLYESNATSSSLRKPTLIYESQRPWIGKSILSTSRRGSRPDHHVKNATARLKSGDSTQGNIILQRGEHGSIERILINGHADRGKSNVQPAPEKTVFIVMKIHDDYHYYSGNGRKQPGNTWYGTVRSNPVRVPISQD